MSEEEMAIAGMSVDNLPEGWAAIPLADLAANRSGNSKLIKGKQSDAPSKAYPYPGFSASGQDVWLSTYDHEGRAIIISAVGARCGKAFEANGKWSAIANTHIVRPNESVLDSRLLWYLINDEKFWIRGGSAQPFVKVNKTFERLFPLAPLAEQKRIADKLDAVLGRVDTCRARLDRVPALLKRFRQSVLTAATTGRLTEEWRTKNGVNSEWENRELLNICSSISDGDHLPPPQTATGIPFLTIGNISSGRLNFTNARSVPESYFENIRATRVPKPGDTLYSVVGASIGIAVMVEVDRKFCFQRHIAILKPSEDTSPGFLHLLMNSPEVFREAWSRTTGTAQPTLSLGALRTIPVSVPPLPEQQEIVRRVEALFAMADRIEARLATAQKTVERLTPATLAKAFRGELVPQDPNDEPASALISRLSNRPIRNLKKVKSSKQSH